MNLKKQHILLMIITCIFYISYGAPSSIQNKIAATLLTQQIVFEAGTPIELEFKINGDYKVQLLCHSSYGISLLDSHKKQGNTIFTIPSHIAKKTGILYYQLLHNKKNIYKGKITIKANTKVTTKIESYIGPPSIIAGGEDYSMLVISPTDFYDNPVKDSTAIEIKHQFLETEKKNTIYSNHFIGWKNLFSYSKSGRLLVASEVNQIQSKEFTVEIFPAQASNFKIDYNRKHKYADGNQIITFKTSIIKDTYGNKVSDGTLVEFIILNKKGVILKTQGTTIDGVAKGKILHPDHSDIWKIKAYITGMATSNQIQLAFNAINTDYKVAFKENNRVILIGPLQSFMNQLIPDGAVVRLKIYTENQLLETKTKTSKDGYVKFNLSKGFYESVVYNFKITVFGIEKEFKNIKI